VIPEIEDEIEAEYGRLFAVRPYAPDGRVSLPAMRPKPGPLTAVVVRLRAWLRARKERPVFALARVRAGWWARLRAWWRTRGRERSFAALAEARGRALAAPRMITCGRCGCMAPLAVDVAEIGVRLCSRCAVLSGDRPCELAKCMSGRGRVEMRLRVRTTGVIVYTCRACSNSPLVRESTEVADAIEGTYVISG